MIGIPKLVGYSLAMSFFTLLITPIFVTQIQLAYPQVNINNTTDSRNIQNNLLITNILAKNLENIFKRQELFLK
jgi:hypothetical protein